jgi:hypothetical protein
LEYEEEREKEGKEGKGRKILLKTADKMSQKATK